MTGASALHELMNSFGITAYEQYSVPTGATFPYITYSFTQGSFGDGAQPLQINLYMQTESNSAINAIGNQIGNAIGNGVMRACDGGGFIIHKGSPFMQSMDDPTTAIKRRYILLSIEWII